MNVQEPPQSKKTNPTIWVIVAILLILVCCILVALVLGGTYIYLQRSGKLNNGVPALPFLSTPRQVGPGAIPTFSKGTLVVEPFDPTSGNFPALPDLVPNWTESTKPASQNWSLTVPANQSVLVILGWCTTTPQLLQQNDRQIKWSLTVDSQPVDLQKLFISNEQFSDRVCKSSAGLIRNWPGTQHKIVTTMTISQKINDGFNDYPAGDYTDIYNVTVSP
jgi:hypothetical protein